MSGEGERKCTVVGLVFSQGCGKGRMEARRRPAEKDGRRGATTGLQVMGGKEEKEKIKGRSEERK